MAAFQCSQRALAKLTRVPQTRVAFRKNNTRAIVSAKQTSRFLTPPAAHFFTSTHANMSAQPAWSDPLPPSETDSSSKLNRYLCILPDLPDSECLSRRMEVRQQHLDEAARGKGVGRVQLGGALLGKDWKDLDERGPPGALAGSALVVLGEVSIFFFIPRWG
jgi:uncharacterized protein